MATQRPTLVASRLADFNTKATTCSCKNPKQIQNERLSFAVIEDGLYFDIVTVDKVILVGNRLKDRRIRKTLGEEEQRSN